jgi:hypothetical protein
VIGAELLDKLREERKYYSGIGEHTVFVLDTFDALALIEEYVNSRKGGPAMTDAIEAIREALRGAIRRMMLSEEAIDGEWGKCRDAEQIEKDYAWSEELYATRKALAALDRIEHDNRTMLDAFKRMRSMIEEAQP